VSEFAPRPLPVRTLQTDQAGSGIFGVLDRTIEAGLRLGARLPMVGAQPDRLTTFRRKTALAIAEKNRSQTEALADGLLRQDPDAIAAFDTIAQGAINEMRAAKPEGLWPGLAAAFDRRFYRNIQEFLDDPKHPMAARVRLLDRLDRINHYLGSYRAWEQIMAMLLPDNDATVRVHDLASGHGGFALALKASWGDRAEVIASDLMTEYLALGREAASRRGLDVEFVKKDATDLGDLADANVDIFTCTQSLHHFSPGMVARMIGESARVARRGICFIDGERGLAPLCLMTTVQGLYSRSWTAIHDTYATFRRMPVAEELLLLAHLVPGIPSDARIVAERRAPGYVYLIVQRG